MFNNVLTMAQTMQVILIGMGVVFFVLFLLTFLVELFRFIPSEFNRNNLLRPKSASAKNNIIFNSLSVRHQAVIIAAVLEDIQTTDSRKFIKIKSIKEL